MSYKYVTQGHVHGGGPPRAEGAQDEGHRRGLQEEQGERPLQEAGGHSGGTLSLRISGIPVAFCSVERAI